MKKLNAKIEYIIAMLIFGSVGLPVRFLPLPSGWIAMLRGLLGCLFLLVLRRKPDLKAFGANGKPLLISGLAIGFNWIFLFEAYRHTTIAVATLLYYLAPVLVLLLSPLVLKEKLTLKQGAVITVALGGMVLVSGIGSSDTGSPRGILMGILAACFYATVMLANRFLKELDPMDRTIYQLGIAGLTVLPYALLREGFSAAWFSGRSILLLLVLGIVYTGFAYLLYFDGLARLPGSASAFLAYLDPVSALLISAVILGEKMGASQLIGAILVLGALLFGEYKRKEK